MKRRLRERFWTLSHFPADVDLEWKEYAEKDDIHPRGPVDAPSEDFLLHWMRRQVRLHDRRDHSVSARVLIVGRTRREDGGCV